MRKQSDKERNGLLIESKVVGTESENRAGSG